MGTASVSRISRQVRFISVVLRLRCNSTIATGFGYLCVVQRVAECQERLDVLRPADSLQIIMAGSINPQIRLRVIGDSAELIAMPERDYFILAAMNYQHWTADELDLVSVAKLVEWKEAIAGHHSKLRHKRTLDDESAQG